MAAGVQIKNPPIHSAEGGIVPAVVPKSFSSRIPGLAELLESIYRSLYQLQLQLKNYTIGILDQLPIFRPDGSKSGYLGFSASVLDDSTVSGLLCDYVRTEDVRAIFDRGITSTQINDGAHGAVINLRKARGTRISKTAVQSGDSIGEFECFGWTGSAWVLGPRIWTEAAENWTGSAQGSRILFGVVPTGSSGTVTAMVIDPDKAIRYDPGGNNFKHFFGTVTPEGNVTANPGSTYQRNNAGTGEFWVKTSGTGNTGWTKVI